MMLDQAKPFQIKSDASKYASGAVLTQLDSNGDQHPVAFLSKTFNETEQNYEIYNRELLAIIWALEEWWHYIQGSGHTTTIYSDHQNLTYSWNAQKLLSGPFIFQSLMLNHPPARIKNGRIWCTVMATGPDPWDRSW